MFFFGLIWVVLILKILIVAASSPQSLPNCHAPTCKLGLNNTICSTRFDDKCPPPGTHAWDCLDEHELTCSGDEKFHCLELDNSNISVLICKIPQICIKGLYPVVNKDLDMMCKYCPSHLYKTVSGWSNIRFVCNLEKSTCSSNEVECHPGNQTHDRECRCDVRKGYYDRSLSVSEQCCAKKHDICTCDYIHCGLDKELLLDGTCFKKCDENYTRTRWSDDCVLDSKYEKPKKTSEGNRSDSTDRLTTTIKTQVPETSSERNVQHNRTFDSSPTENFKSQRDVFIIVAAIFSCAFLATIIYLCVTNKMKRKGSRDQAVQVIDERNVEKGLHHRSSRDYMDATDQNGSTGILAQNGEACGVAMSSLSSDRLTKKNQVQKGPMKVADAKKIHANVVKIKKVINLKDHDLLDNLVADFIISGDDKEEIKCKQSQGVKDGNEQLIDTLLRRGEGAFSGFIEALQKSGYGDLANVIENTPIEEEASSNNEKDIVSREDEAQDEAKEASEPLLRNNSEVDESG